MDGIVELRRQNYDKSMWGEDLSLVFVRASEIPDKTSCAIPGRFISPEFEDMGFALCNESGGLAIAIEKPDMPIDDTVIQTLMQKGFERAAADSLAVFGTYTDMAEKIARAYFKNPDNVSPTIKIKRGIDDSGNKTVESVHLMMKGTPNGNPSWHFNGYNAA